MIRLDIFSDPVCPWCYLGKANLDRALAANPAHPFQIQWHPFQLNPDMPPEGEDAESHVMRKYGISAEQSRANSERLAGAAADLGFVFNRGLAFRMRNSFDAHRLLAWAAGCEAAEPAGTATGVQTALKLALFRAHFTDNRDVGDPQVLADVAASAGLDPARAATILAGDAYAEEVRAEEAYWADNNITGVPAFILGGRMLIPGAQDPEVFVRIIENKLLTAAA